MRNLRIIFMGTPAFAVHILKTLIEYNYHVVGVVTAPDKPAGRGMKLQEPAVKQYAASVGLKVLQPLNLKDENFIAELKSLGGNLQIVVAFRMLPKAVWQLPEYGTFNLHASLLPQYRGAAPINWAIINGETATGVTTFFIDDKIDTGAMILQREVSIMPDETAGTLHDKLMVLGAGLVLETVEQIQQGNVVARPQTESRELKPAPKLTKENCKLNFSKSIHEVYNHVRGLSPYPAAYATLQQSGKEIDIKVFEADIAAETPVGKPGSMVVTKTEWKIAVANGYLKLIEIQLPGKKRMKAKEALNGFTLSADAMFT